MSHIKNNKTLVLKFYKCISGNKKSRKLLSRFSNDPKLIDHFLYFESFIPMFNIIVDEITAEGSKVCVKARYKGMHSSQTFDNGVIYKAIEFPYVMGYTIECGMIKDHWIVGEQLSLLQQLNLF